MESPKLEKRSAIFGWLLLSVFILGADYMSKRKKSQKKPNQTVSPQAHPKENDGNVSAGQVPTPEPPTNTNDTKNGRGDSVVWRWLARIGIVAGIGYAVVTYCMYRRMGEANELNQKAFHVTQKSYVTIGRKDGVVARFIPSQKPEQKAELVLYFQNSGHVPAKLAWGTWGANNALAFIAGGGQSSGISYTHPFNGMSRTRDKKTGSIGQKGESAVIPGESTFVAPLGEISQSDLDALPGKNVATLVMGMYQYCDELGTNVRHLFSLSYQNAPDADLTFKLVSDTDLPVITPPPSPTTEYLSPCPTLDEQNK